VVLFDWTVNILNRIGWFGGSCGTEFGDGYWLFSQEYKNGQRDVRETDSPVWLQNSEDFKINSKPGVGGTRL
jgi:hypothetical protein